MIDNKVFKKIESDIKQIIAGLPHNANRREKIAAICRKHRFDRETAKRFL